MITYDVIRTATLISVKKQKFQKKFEVRTKMECNGDVLMDTQRWLFDMSTDDEGASDSSVN